MQSLLYGLVHWNELNTLIKHGVETDSEFFCEEPKTKYILHITEVFLEVLYIFMIVYHKGISVANFCVTAYVGVCAASLVSKGWKLYGEFNERRKIRKKIKSMSGFFSSGVTKKKTPIECQNVN